MSDGLSIAERARRIAELQRGRTGASDEAAICELFLAARGTDLTLLKNAIDAGDDHRDLLQLLYRDIDDHGIRETILAHISAEAGQAASEARLKVLSDIDDTFYANWKDERFPKKTIYPGVRQLYRELSEEGVVFVTARPGDRAGIVEGRTHRSLRERGVEATVLAGSLGSALGNSRIAKKKLENFVRYAEVFPEYGFVFIGDSGQGDATFGKGMLAHAPARVRAVFIHDVVGTAAEERARWAEAGVFFFDSYAGAAGEALRRGLLSAAAAVRVCEAATAELEGLALPDALLGVRREELARDVARVRADAQAALA